MIKLEPMSSEQFETWKEVSIREYAEDKIKAGNMQAENALEESQKEFDQLLPEGPRTAGNYLYAVEDVDSRNKVGILWIKIRHDLQDVFIYDIRMDEAFRGQGYGRQTLQALEEMVKDMGLSKISLHVFGDNKVAQNLYRSFGFYATNILMSKNL